MPFPLPVPPLPQPKTPSIYELAATLHIMNVEWAKSVQEFVRLPNQDKTILMEESWSEMFVLSLSLYCLVYIPNFDFRAFVRSSYMLTKEQESDPAFIGELDKLQESLLTLGHFRIDHNEFVLLRAIILFKSTYSRNVNIPPNGSPKLEVKRVSDEVHINILHEQSQLALRHYVCTTKPAQPLRFGQLMMILPRLKNISSIVIETLFFKVSIGNTPMKNVLNEILFSDRYS